MSNEVSTVEHENAVEYGRGCGYEVVWADILIMVRSPREALVGYAECSRRVSLNEVKRKSVFWQTTCPRVRRKKRQACVKVLRLS